MAGAAVLTVADTIARSFVLAAEKRGDKPAIREKKFGIWQPTSWRQWQQISKDIAYALHAVGFRPGDVVTFALVDGSPPPADFVPDTAEGKATGPAREQPSYQA